MEEQNDESLRDRLRSQRELDNELTTLRQWYHELPTYQRHVLLPQLWKLSTLAREFRMQWNLSLFVQFCRRRNLVIGGELRNDQGIGVLLDELLDAISEWNKLEEFFDSGETEG